MSEVLIETGIWNLGFGGEREIGWD